MSLLSNYLTSQTSTSQYKNVNGEESISTGGVTRATTRSKEAGVMYNGISISPDELIVLLRGRRREVEAEAEAEQAKQEPELEGFSSSTNMLLDDIDKGDLANAINQAINGNLTDDNIINAVRVWALVIEKVP